MVRGSESGVSGVVVDKCLLADATIIGEIIVEIHGTDILRRVGIHRVENG